MGIFDITDKYMEAKSAQVNSEFKPKKITWTTISCWSAK